jgi:hypothetical protein
MGTTLIQAEYQSLIFEICGYKVMIDTDLAALYETETKVLKQQVKRKNKKTYTVRLASKPSGK